MRNASLRHSGWIAVVAALIAGAWLLVAPARAGQAAEVYVQGLADDVMAVINDESLSAGQKRNQLSSILDGNIDIEEIALFCLGQYRKGASQSARDDYIPAFRAYLIGFYVGQLSDLEGASLKVTGSEDLGGQKGTVVYSEAETDGDTTEINWRVLNASSIRDVEVEGVWVMSICANSSSPSSTRTGATSRQRPSASRNSRIELRLVVLSFGLVTAGEDLRT
ncbi:MAG: ABC transporter substrate-binding protein [Alphaproteobacteria bacterium]